MIELKNVSKFYNDNNIVTVGLRNVSLKLNKGEFVAITGDSGSGKSTLLNVISAIDTYDDGEILFYGNETFYFNQNDNDLFRKNNVSFIFQKYNIIDSYTVLQNVMLPLIIKGKSYDEAKIEALEIIKRVGLEERTLNRGTNLSGGEKQRCVIARALASDSPILACDEPTGNLDSKTSDEIISLIKEVAKDKLVLMVTHDFDKIKDICTRKIKLSDGEVVEDVIYYEGIEEENKELILEEYKPSNKILNKLAMSNIISTPKKTMFTTLVFSVVSCALLLLSLLMVKVSYDANYTNDREYGIISDNRMVIYAEDNQSIDMSILSSILDDEEYYINPFYEELETCVNLGLKTIWVGFTFADIDYKLINGTDELKDNEFIVVIPKSHYDTSYVECIDEQLNIMYDMRKDTSLSLGIVKGIATSTEINKIYILGKNYNSKIVSMCVNNSVEFNLYSEDGDILLTKYDNSITKPYIAVPKRLKDKFMLNIILDSLYKVSYDMEIIYTDDVMTPTLFINQDFIGGNVEPKFEGVKEIVLYTKNINKTQKEIINSGYIVSIPSKVKNDNKLNLVVLYFLTALVVVALFIMFYISYAIIQKVYLTKAKDYSIFRTLGLISQDVKKILYIENFTIIISSIILGFIFSILITIFGKMDLFEYLSFLLVVIYTIVMLIFALLISIRLNNKIFKFSIFQSIKEGSE